MSARSAEARGGDASENEGRGRSVARVQALGGWAGAGRARTGMLDGLLLLLARGQAGEELALPPGEDGLLHRRLVRYLDVRHELRCLLLRLLLLPGA